MNGARGLFRLWVVIAAVWIGGASYSNWPPTDLTYDEHKTSWMNPTPAPEGDMEARQWYNFLNATSDAFGGSIILFIVGWTVLRTSKWVFKGFRT